MARPNSAIRYLDHVTRVQWIWTTINAILAAGVVGVIAAIQQAPPIEVILLGFIAAAVVYGLFVIHEIRKSQRVPHLEAEPVHSVTTQPADNGLQVPSTPALKPVQSSPQHAFIALTAKAHALRNRIASYDGYITRAEGAVADFEALLVRVEGNEAVKDDAGRGLLDLFGTASDLVRYMSLTVDGQEWQRGAIPMPQVSWIGEGPGGGGFEFDPKKSAPFIYTMRQELSRMHAELNRARSIDQALASELTNVSRDLDKAAEDLHGHG